MPELYCGSYIKPLLVLCIRRAIKPGHVNRLQTCKKSRGHILMTTPHTLRKTPYIQYLTSWCPPTHHILVDTLLHFTFLQLLDSGVHSTVKDTSWWPPYILTTAVTCCQPKNLSLYRGHQPFSRGHHLVGTLVLRDMLWTLHARLRA